MVAVYYGERIHFEIREGNRHVGQSPGETRPKFPVVLPQWGWYRQQQCVTNELSVANQGSSQRLGVQESCWGSVAEAWNSCVTDLSLSVSRFPPPSLLQKSNWYSMALSSQANKNNCSLYIAMLASSIGPGPMSQVCRDALTMHENPGAQSSSSRTWSSVSPFFGRCRV